MSDNVTTLDNVELSEFCTYHTGGKARKIKIVYDVDGLISAAQDDCFVIGSGSKLLISDKGYDGTVILMRISGIKRTEKGVYAYAGVPLPALSRFCEANRLGGLEWACGIPGSVGGGVKLNCGAFGGSMSDVIASVDVLNGDKVERIPAEKIEFGYRTSNITLPIVGAEFCCHESDNLASKRKEYFLRRKSTQPRGFSCGSVFLKADKPAGYYIEQAGLKGKKFGGAVISETHANFILNNGFATSKDIYTLIRSAKAEVKSKFGVSLKEEVIYLGEFY